MLPHMPQHGIETCSAPMPCKLATLRLIMNGAWFGPVAMRKASAFPSCIASKGEALERAAQPC